MAGRPRISWQLLSGDEGLWTPGWLPDSGILRWSLANDIRVESVRDGWAQSFEAAEAAALTNGYVAENDEGEWVEVTWEGEALDGSRYPSVRSATFARLPMYN